MNTPHVLAVHRAPDHVFSKPTVDEVTLLAGLGVEGDAHCGAQVKHRSRVAADPTQPNLRQVHLIHAELLDELTADGHHVPPGSLGENVTTRGIDLLGLATGTVLRLGDTALLGVTGLRNPCRQIEDFAPGVLAKVARRTTDADGNDAVERRSGVMAVVLHGGVVRAGDAIEVAPPPGPAMPLERV